MMRLFRGLARSLGPRRPDPFRAFREVLAEGPASAALPLDSALAPARVELCDAWLAGWYPDDGSLYPNFPVSENDVVLNAGTHSEHVLAFCRAQGARMAVEASAGGRATRILCLDAVRDSSDPAALLAGLFAAGQGGARYLIAFPADWHVDVLRELGAHPGRGRGYARAEARALIEQAGLAIIEEASDGFCSALAHAFDLAAPEGAEHSAATLAWAGCWAVGMAGPQGGKIQNTMNELMPLRHLFVAVKPGRVKVEATPPAPKRQWPLAWAVPEDRAIDAVDAGDIALRIENLAGWFNRDRQEVVPGFSVGPNDTLIDLGCGDGGIASFCAEFRPTAIVADIDPANVARARKRVADVAGQEPVGLVSDSNPIPLGDSAVTRAVCIEVLEHVEDPDIVMAELFRVGRPGALYLLTVPGVLSERTQAVLGPPQYFQHPNHIRIVDPDSFRAMVERAGLVVERYSANGFHHSINCIFVWQTGLPLGTQHHSLNLWMRTWQMAVDGPRGMDLMQVFNRAMPKRQIIVARKPMA